MEIIFKDGDIIGFEIEKFGGELRYSCSIRSIENDYNSPIRHVNAKEVFPFIFKGVKDDRVLNQLVKNVAEKCTQIKDDGNYSYTAIYVGDEGRALVFGNGNGAYALDALVEEAEIAAGTRLPNSL